MVIYVYWGKPRWSEVGKKLTHIFQYTENFKQQMHSINERGHYIFYGEVSSFSANFLILKCKISKIQKRFACGALIFNIDIFRFKTDAGLQVDIDFK